MCFVTWPESLVFKSFTSSVTKGHAPCGEIRQKHTKDDALGSYLISLGLGEPVEVADEAVSATVMLLLRASRPSFLRWLKYRPWLPDTSS